MEERTAACLRAILAHLNPLGCDDAVQGSPNEAQAVVAQKIVNMIYDPETL